MKLPVKTKLCLASAPNKKPLNEIGMVENVEQHVFSKQLSEFFKIIYMHQRSIIAN